ncbi:hypothetical protein DFH07DRAFT_771402 [Mycena maculata]|uniref:Uncharacterized protein n=1 Tax=Mycena maculata TaxID=230809 RepID=A0AAD7JBV0_9AGAR|nr:hypothetical protein DFH07DRAFT_771402 [Mycena maculata]
MQDVDASQASANSTTNASAADTSPPPPPAPNAAAINVSAPNVNPPPTPPAPNTAANTNPPPAPPPAPNAPIVDVSTTNVDLPPAPLTAGTSASNVIPAPAAQCTTNDTSEEEETRLIPPCPAMAPQWFSMLYHEFSQKDLGRDFNALLELFVALEELYGWVKGGGKALGTQHCPPQVTVWVSTGRGSWGGAMANGVGPAIMSLPVFIEQWWQWWGRVQLSWRLLRTGNTERFERDKWPAGGVENWSTLRHLGPNRALSLVATLY